MSWAEALAAAAEGLGRARVGRPRGRRRRSAAPQLTNEGAYAWAKLAKGVIGTDSVDAQLGDGLPAELVLSLPRATIDEACAGPAGRAARPATSARSCPSCSCGCAGGRSPGRRRSSSSRRRLHLAHLATRPPRCRCARATRPPSPAALVGDAERAAGPDPSGGPGLARRGARRRARAPRRGRAERRRASWSWSAALAGRGRVGAWPRRPARWPRPCPGARFLSALRRGNVHGALDMGLAPGAPPRPGAPRGRAGLVRASTGARCPAADRPRRRGHAVVCGRGAAGGRGPPGRSSSSGPTRSSDFPDHRLADDALAAAELVIVVAGHHTAPSLEHADVVLPGGGGPRARRHDHQHRGPGQPARPEAGRPRARLAGLDDRRRAGRRARRRTSGSPRPTAYGTRSSGWRRRTAASRSAVLESAGAHDGVVVPLGAADRGPPGRPLDPIAIPGVESVERQGAPPRVGVTEPPTELRRPTPTERRRRPHCSPGPARRRRPGRAAARQLLAAPGLERAASTTAGPRVGGSPSLAPLVGGGGRPGQPLRPRPARAGGRRRGDACAPPARQRRAWRCRADRGGPAGRARRRLQPRPARATAERGRRCSSTPRPS